MLFDDVTLVLPDRLQAAARLRVEAGLIVEFGSRAELAARAGEPVVDGRGGYLAPGFIDLHVHGGLGRDTMEAAGDAFETILRFHASAGTTALNLTTVAAPWPQVARVLDTTRRWKAQANAPSGCATLLGVHVEGPYFSPARAGAHRPEYLRLPTAEDVAPLLESADVIRQVTLAPELPGALDLIAALRARGVIASGGHSDAWDEAAHAAFDRGMEQVTHVFNAMSSARRRGLFRVAGLLEFALAEPGIRCELIADGQHVTPTLLQLAYRAKGAAGICLVTDACPGAGLPDGSTFRFLDRDCVVSGAVCMTADGSALSGSRITLGEGVRNMVRLAGVPLEEAVRMASLNPARALRVEHERGLLAAGLQADLVLLNDDLRLERTFIGGRGVESALC